MAIISDLSRDLVEEVLARVPVTSLRAVRFTCKYWNDLSKDGNFIKKQAKEFKVIMIVDFRVYLMSVNLSNDDPSIRPKGELISLNDDADHQAHVYRVFHCDGLLLCISNDIKSRLLVCNPSFGQTKWIKPRNSYHDWDEYALGYEKKMNSWDVSHKVLRMGSIGDFELYSLKSNSWKVLDIIFPDLDIELCQLGLSLKGNTYWYAKEKSIQIVQDVDDFLICFDFTRERFGLRLPLPFHSSPVWSNDIITLSSVGEEQLAVLFQDESTLMTTIWVTSKIEPNEVSWNKLFLAVNTTQLPRFQIEPYAASFFIDLKQNVVVVFDRDVDVS